MTADPESELRKKLGELLPLASDSISGFDGGLRQSFITVKSLLSHKFDVKSFWLPDVLLTMLPAELWQVLVYWATVHADVVLQAHFRQEVVRFALFWRLCVWNNEKAANTAFAYIKENKSADFPGAALYQRLIGITQSDPYADALLSPDEFTCKLCKSESPAWRTDEERFVENKLRNAIGSNW